MGLLEQQNFLARIFTDESLRLSFWDDPARVGAENGLLETDITQLKEIIPADLNYFANSLFHKRLHEVERLLPLTKKALDKDFSGLFREFSNNFQPTKIRKHLEDALGFCQFLQSNTTSRAALDTAKFEMTRHKFFQEEKLLAFCLLKYDVFTLKRKYGICIWYRLGKTIYHFIL